MAAPRRVLTCTLGAAWEPALLRIAEHPAAALRVEARCGEPGEALGVAMRDRPDVVVAEDVPGWWDRDVVARFTELGIAVVVVGDAPPGARPCDASPEAIVAAVHDLGGAPVAPPPGEEPTPTGRVTAVWGGHGAPGRTTLAIHLASAHARVTDALLIDADVWSPSVALRLGLVAERGLVHAVRSAAQGTDPLDAAISRRRDLHVLTGLGRAELWPELREASFEAVLQAARGRFAETTVDLAAPIEEDEGLAFDEVPFRRNLVTRSVLVAADRVLLVVAADPVGVARGIAAGRLLASELPEAAAQMEVTVNGATDRRAAVDAVSTLERHLGRPVVTSLPFEAKCDAAQWEGCTVPELTRRSAYWSAVGAMAKAVAA